MRTLKNLSVLIVEDDDDHADLILAQLRAAGLPRESAHRARSREEALSFLEEGEVSVILLDLGLPESHSLDTLRAVLPGAGALPIVVLTALDEGELGTQAVRQGAQDFLVKSEMSSELLLRSILYSIERKQVFIDLEQRNRELAHFAHTIAHDLSQPIRATRNLCQFIREDNEGKLPEESEEHLEMASRSCQRMETMVRALLEYSEIGASSLEFRVRDLEGILQDVIEDLGPQIEEVDGAVEISVEDCSVNVCEPLIRNVFQNLISNSLKYRGDRTPRIRIYSERKGSELIVGVEDNGIGIPERYRDRIFELFFHLGRQEEPGAGVGLATCKKLVNLHGGRIWVESEEEQGTTIFLSLPQEPAHYRSDRWAELREGHDRSTAVSTLAAP